MSCCLPSSSNGAAPVQPTGSGDSQPPVVRTKVEELAITKGWYSNITNADFVSIYGHRVLRVTLQKPIPEGYRIDSYANNNWLCLRNNELGGMWKIISVSEGSRVVHCEISKKFYGDGDAPGPSGGVVGGRNGAGTIVSAAVAAGAASSSGASGSATAGGEVTAFAEPIQPAVPLSFISEDHFDWEVVQREDRTIVVAKSDIHNEPLARIHPDECMSAKQGYVFILQPLVAICRANVHNVGSIDTIDQSFVTSFLSEVRLRGICKHVDPLYVQQFMKLLNFEEKLYVLRIKEEQSIERYSSYTQSVIPGYYDYAMKIVMKGTFHEEFELQSFPLDIQDLNVVITCNRPNIVTFQPNIEYPSLFMLQDFQLKSVFDVAYKELIMIECNHSNPLESSSGYVYPRFNFRTRLARKSGYYASNVAIPIGIISALSIISMSINEDGSRLETADRLGITLTLLLTAVAYKFVVASSLPTLSYQTLLDKYVWCCFAFMIIISIENAIVPIIINRCKSSGNNSSSVENAESYLALVLGVIYFLVNAYWFVLAWTMMRTYQSESEQVYREEKERRAIAAATATAGTTTTR